MGGRATRPVTASMARCGSTILTRARRGAEAEHREREFHAGGGEEGASEAEGSGLGRRGECHVMYGYSTLLAAGPESIRQRQTGTTSQTRR